MMNENRQPIFANEYEYDLPLIRYEMWHPIDKAKKGALKFSIIFIILFMLAAVAILIYQVIFGQWNDIDDYFHNFVLPVSSGIFAAILLSTLLYAPKNGVKKARLANKTDNINIKIYFFEDELEAYEPFQRCIITYDKFNSIFQNEKFIYLMINKNAYYRLLINGFTKGNAEGFKVFIHEKIKSRL